MGYEVRIARVAEPDAEDGGVPIEQWERVVAADPALTVVEPSGGIATVEWSGHPQGRAVAFWFDEGRVWTKSPDEPVVAKMLELAAILAARVFGDDGEEYGVNAQGELTADGETTVRNDAPWTVRAAPWIAILVIIVAVIGAMALAARQ